MKTRTPVAAAAPSGGEHGVLRLQGHQPARHLALVRPGRQRLDDLGLGGDGKGGHIVHPGESGPPGGGQVASHESAGHAGWPLR